MTRKGKEGCGSQAVLKVSDPSNVWRGTTGYENQEGVFCFRIR